jgi:hypothetical protein
MTCDEDDLSVHNGKQVVSARAYLAQFGVLDLTR